MTSKTSVVQIRLPLANAYLVIGERPVLIDTGAPGDLPRIEKTLAEQGIAWNDLALVLHTHGHGDHVGSSAALREVTSAPMAIMELMGGCS